MNVRKEIIMQFILDSVSKAEALPAIPQLVCVFCGHESLDSDYRYCCGEYGAVLDRQEYIDYMGYDYFADID